MLNYDISSVEELTMEQATIAIGKIEAMYKRPMGEIDLTEMAKNKNLFSAWRQLRERIRKNAKLKQNIS